jgi:hypothetical protein
LTLAEKISRDEAVSLVNDVALGLARLDIVGGPTLRALGLSELPHYLTSFYTWGKGLSNKPPTPIPRELAERTKEVLKEKLEEKLVKLREGYDIAVAALDKLSQT